MGIPWFCLFVGPYPDNLAKKIQDIDLSMSCLFFSVKSHVLSIYFKKTKPLPPWLSNGRSLIWSISRFGPQTACTWFKSIVSDFWTVHHFFLRNTNFKIQAGHKFCRPWDLLAKITCTYSSQLIANPNNNRCIHQSDEQ